jgi:hypothetical protein
MTDITVTSCFFWVVVVWATHQSFKKYRAVSTKTDGFLLQFARWFVWPEISGPDRALEIKQLARGTFGLIPIVVLIMVYGDVILDIEAYDYELIGALLATFAIVICIMVVRHDQLILFAASAWFVAGLYLLIRSPLQVRIDSKITVLLGALVSIHQSAVILRAWMWFRTHTNSSPADRLL